jgi:hypothetical protein
MNKLKSVFLSALLSAAGFGAPLAEAHSLVLDCFCYRLSDGNYLGKIATEGEYFHSSYGTGTVPKRENACQARYGRNSFTFGCEARY